MTPSDTVRALKETLGRVAAVAKDPLNSPEVRTLALAVAMLTKIAAEQEQRLVALEACQARDDRGPHVWLDDGTCGYCRSTRQN